MYKHGEVSDPKLDALCSNGSKKSSSRNHGSAPQQSYKVGYRYSVEISLRCVLFSMSYGIPLLLCNTSSCVLLFCSSVTLSN